MPRPSKGARLYLRRGRNGDRFWIIRDGTKDTATGCAEGDIGRAEEKLERYIAEKYQAPRRERRLSDIPITDVLAIYAADKLPSLSTFEKATGRIARLGEWWGGKTLADVTGRNCRKFAADRGDGAARRELQDLQAAISYHLGEGFHREIVKVTLPAPGLPRERWLTRDEVAKLLWICWRTKHGGRSQDHRQLRHIARFILFAVYTGSRPGDVLVASFRMGSGGLVDVGRGLYYRRPAGKRETKKRQPTTPIPARLLAHLRRWSRDGSMAVVHEGNGRHIGSIKTAWHSLVEKAGPEFADVIPYTLRHTAITWLMQRGTPIWEVAGFAGTSEEMIRRVYGHHHPAYLQQAANAIGRK